MRQRHFLRIRDPILIVHHNLRAVLQRITLTRFRLFLSVHLPLTADGVPCRSRPGGRIGRCHSCPVRTRARGHLLRSPEDKAEQRAEVKAHHVLTRAQNIERNERTGLREPDPDGTRRIYLDVRFAEHRFCDACVNLTPDIITQRLIRADPKIHSLHQGTGRWIIGRTDHKAVNPDSRECVRQIGKKRCHIQTHPGDRSRRIEPVQEQIGIRRLERFEGLRLEFRNQRRGLSNAFHTHERTVRGGLHRGDPGPVRLPKDIFQPDGIRLKRFIGSIPAGNISQRHIHGLEGHRDLRAVHRHRGRHHFREALERFKNTGKNRRAERGILLRHKTTGLRVQIQIHLDGRNELPVPQTHRERKTRHTDDLIAHHDLKSVRAQIEIKHHAKVLLQHLRQDLAEFARLPGLLQKLLGKKIQRDKDLSDHVLHLLTVDPVRSAKPFQLFGHIKLHFNRGRPGPGGRIP
ncbi:MAG: hypothetical protein BWY49_00549 [Candidatus Omnitrophica bacterium ADurb.Bin314]|nr:MAG: hypothetical protein BWY49_00549 [Candidatus Omnitrophica bacterium ADurb.Bin314]